jgi:HK97 gp10 family phage protein
MAIEFKFKDNSDIVLKAAARATKEAAGKMAEIARDAVQYQILYGYKDPHGKDGHTEIVETGRLFDSIEAKVSIASQNAYSVTVGTDVPYAKYVHEGTRKLKARRFIRDGLAKADKELEQAALEAFKNA